MQYCFHHLERIDMEFHGEAKGNPSIRKREFYRYLDRMHLGLWAVNFGVKKNQCYADQPNDRLVSIEGSPMHSYQGLTLQNGLKAELSVLMISGVKQSPRPKFLTNLSNHQSPWRGEEPGGAHQNHRGRTGYSALWWV